MQPPHHVKVFRAPNHGHFLTSSDETWISLETRTRPTPLKMIYVDGLLLRLGPTRAPLLRYRWSGPTPRPPR